MRIVSWNLGHQTRERELKTVFGPAIRALSPDTLILNEYVDGGSRGELKADLAGLGLSSLRVSKQVGKNNQVLIASRNGFDEGDLSAPRTTDADPSNFLHVRFSGEGFELVGVRVPAYSGAQRTKYWAELTTLITSTANRRILFVGDFNADPASRELPGGRALAGLAAAGWQIPSPRGAWSYCSVRSTSRIDHAVVSPRLVVTDAEYLNQIGDVVCAGNTKELYDHAPLVIEVRDRLPNER
jgi:exonuclease III